MLVCVILSPSKDCGILKRSDSSPKRRSTGFVRAIICLIGLGIAGIVSLVKSGPGLELPALLEDINVLQPPPPTPEQLAVDLSTAAASGNLAAVEELISAGAKPDSLSAASTPLIQATLGGHGDVIESLVRHGAPVDQPDAAGLTPLRHALGRTTQNAAIKLLNLGADPQVTTPDHEPALVFAARTRNSDLLRALVSNQSNEANLPNLADALALCVTNNDPTLTRLLLEAGASPIPFETGGPNALDIAVRSGNFVIADLILSHHGPDLLQTIAPDLLNTTVTNQHPELLESLLAHGADPDIAFGEEDRLPLDLAVQNGDLIATSHLLDHCSSTGDHLAVALADSNGALVDLLLANGADASAATVDGEAPLIAAIRNGDTDLAVALVRAGADPAAVGRENQSALSLAVALRQAPVASALLAAGADPNKRLNDPISQEFMDLIEGGDSLKYYLKRDKRFTPVMIAAGLADHETIKTLLANGASRGVYTRSWKRYPVSFAFTSKDIYAQQLMLGRDPQKEDPAEQRNVLISLSNQKATLFKNGEIIATTKISSGKKSTPTPKGKFVISDKHRHHTSSIYHVAMPYFQRLSGQAFGFHTGYVPNYPASHGCIRMPNSNAKKFFSLTKVGDPVTIMD